MAKKLQASRPGRAQMREDLLSDAMLSSEPGELLPTEIEQLWELFLQIAVIWENRDQEMKGKLSSWLEFVRERCVQAPSYLAEYRNALAVLEELAAQSNRQSASGQLLLEHELPQRVENQWNRPWTRLDHAKKFVGDEFILVYVVAAGFRDFGSDENGKNRSRRRPYNYNGFVRGSRYNRVKRVRHYDAQQSKCNQFSELKKECDCEDSTKRVQS